MRDAKTYLTPANVAIRAAARTVALLAMMMVVCLVASRPGYPDQWSDPQRYLEDKQEALLAGHAVLATVRVESVTDAWLLVEGDWYPYQVVTLVSQGNLAGAEVPTQVAVLLGRACPGQTYLMYASQQGTEMRLDDVPIRWLSREFRSLWGQGDDQFFDWAPTGIGDFDIYNPSEKGARYRLKDLTLWLQNHPQPVPLGHLLSGRLRTERVSQLIAGHQRFTPEDVLAALDPMVLGHDEQAAYRALALMRDAALAQNSARPGTVDRLRHYMSTLSPRLQFASACALAELGSPDGRVVLTTYYERGGTSLATVAEGIATVMIPGLFQYDVESPTLTAAYYLGLLGDGRGLTSKDPRVQLAAASGLVDRFPSQIKPAIGKLLNSEELQVDTLRKQGKLNVPRKRGDSTDRYPANWVKASALLARTGSQEALQHLVDAWLLDFSTYPPGDPLTADVTSIVVESTPHSVEWPSLPQAIVAADSDKRRLLSRLAQLYADKSSWKSMGMVSLRTALTGKPTQTSPSPPRPNDDSAKNHDEVVRLLAASDAASRERGIVAAGKYRYPDLYDQVLNVAESDTGDPGAAALFALTLYHRPIDPAAGTKLLGIGDIDRQLNALELVTRPGAQPFKAEIWKTLATAAVESAHRTDPSDSRARTASFVLSRLFRAEIPDTASVLSTPKLLQLWIIQGLYQSGNLAAEPLLKQLVSAPELTVRRAAASTLAAFDPLVEVPAVSAPENPPAGILSIHGITIGTLEADVRSHWQSRVRRNEGNYFEFYPTASNDSFGTVSVHFRGGKVVQVNGDQLELDGKLVLKRHDHLADVTRQFGEPEESSYDEAAPTIGWVRYVERKMFVSVSPSDGIGFIILDK